MQFCEQTLQKKKVNYFKEKERQQNNLTENGKELALVLEHSLNCSQFIKFVIGVTAVGDGENGGVVPLKYTLIVTADKWTVYSSKLLSKVTGKKANLCRLERENAA